MLTYPTLKAIITDEEKQDELNSDAIILPLPSSCNTLVIPDGTSTPTFDQSFLRITDGQENTPLNYSQGMSVWFLDVMVSDNDINEAKQRNQHNRNEGKSLKEKMEGWRKVAGGKLFPQENATLDSPSLNTSRKTKQHRREKTRLPVRRLALLK